MGANNSWRARDLERKASANEARFRVPERLMSRTELETGLRSAYRDASELFASARLEMDDYSHKVPTKQLAEHKESVRVLGAKFGKDPLTVERMAAAVTEGVLYRAAADCGWFGSEAKSYATSLLY